MVNARGTILARTARAFIDIERTVLASPARLAGAALAQHAVGARTVRARVRSTLIRLGLAVVPFVAGDTLACVISVVLLARAAIYARRAGALVHVHTTQRAGKAIPALAYEPSECDRGIGRGLEADLCANGVTRTGKFRMSFLSYISH